jgi:hypothetical protein
MFLKIKRCAKEQALFWNVTGNIIILQLAHFADCFTEINQRKPSLQGNTVNILTPQDKVPRFLSMFQIY